MRQPQLVPEGLMTNMHALLDGSAALVPEVPVCHTAYEFGKAWHGCIMHSALIFSCCTAVCNLNSHRQRCCSGSNSFAL